MSWFSLVVPAFIGAIAWLYQKAWERQERRIQQYQEIIDALPSFTVRALDPDGINKAIAAHRRLWIFGSDKVVKEFDAFFTKIEHGAATQDELAAALGRCVLAMREDVAFRSALFPKWRSTLEATDFKLKGAAGHHPSAPTGYKVRVAAKAAASEHEATDGR